MGSMNNAITTPNTTTYITVGSSTYGNFGSGGFEGPAGPNPRIDGTAGNAGAQGYVRVYFFT